MSFASVIKSEFVKIRHTAFCGIHIIMSVLGVSVFLLYFSIYPERDIMWKLRFMSEVTATIFPLLISVVIGINIMLEEKASAFYSLLAVPDRKKMIAGKIMVLYLSGTAACISLYGLWNIGMIFFNKEEMPTMIIIELVLGMVLSGMFYYVFHLFLNLRFGIGISVFCGVFESMQSILYSNVELQGIVRLIPFAWMQEWIQIVLQKKVEEHIPECLAVIVLIICSLLLFLEWFAGWEGRKHEE